jgi:hypothetical protein
MADKKPTVPDWDPKKDDSYKEFVSRTAQDTKGAKRRSVEGARRTASRTSSLSRYRADRYGEVFGKRSRARTLLPGSSEYMEDTIKSKAKRQEKFTEDSNNAYKAREQWKTAEARRKKLREMANKKEAK